MKDLSLHLLDILENAARAGAQRVEVTMQWSENILKIRIEDNGPGFPPAVRDNPVDPYATTRTDRPVGLGLALLKEAAEATGRRLMVSSIEGRGVNLEVEFDMAHVDAKPLGDVTGAVMTAVFGWPDMNIVLRAGSSETPVLDMEMVKKELGNVSISEPEVQDYIRRELATGLEPLAMWADSVMEGSLVK